MRTYGRAEIKLHAFLLWTLNEDERYAASLPGRFRQETATFVLMSAFQNQS